LNDAQLSPFVPSTTAAMAVVLPSTVMALEVSQLNADP
jgi:hypothetical protein